jgi:hypothetical protein
VYETYEQQDGELTRRLGRVEEGADEEGEGYCGEAKAEEESNNSPEVGVLNSPPTVMIEHRKESVKPMRTPSEMK